MIKEDPDHKSAGVSQMVIFTDNSTDETVATFDDTEGIHIPEVGSRITLRHIVDEKPDEEGYDTRSMNMYEVEKVGSDYSLLQFRDEEGEWVDKTFNYVHVFVEEVGENIDLDTNER
ncbi:hypothetical protein [Natrialba magadii]|uniref:hypothetical protein n=1 Tax=Natrialba magadii TaxID=13769 RepID=UPI0011D0C44B|nr:hypothetical protein [Natrialba magadii]